MLFLMKQFMSNMLNNCEFGKWLSHPPSGEEVVIAGISGRFPESNNVHEFKENLLNKIDMITDDDRRWKLDDVDIPQRSGKISNINKIDAGYFGIHYRQIDVMDPIMRKFLESSTEAIIDAGLNPSELEGSKTAVLVGSCYTDMETDTLINIAKSDQLGITGYLRSMIAHRVSYFLKLKGPSIIVDTACSSSLNALEQAFRYIRMGKCDNAIVGGVNLIMHPNTTRQYLKLGVLSADGKCKVFDEKADGYVRSEASVCVFLQKASNAKRVYAKIIYSKVNCDGFKKSGITFPSMQMQQQLMNEILQDSGVNASEVSYIEAHGTGTQAGDPQEVGAIDGAIAKNRNEPLLIGSVKSNVGHGEPASGLFSLVKVIIAMETGYIPPNIHLEKTRAELLGLKEERMKVVTEATELNQNDAIMGINNFGFGGNNAQVLLKRFSKSKMNGSLPDDDLPRLVCVSGRTEKGVLTLLEDINKRSLDYEYIYLFHQIFKGDVSGHGYRGFTIVSKNGPIKPDFKCVLKKNLFYVFFGKFEKGYKILHHFLNKFQCFRTTMIKFNKIIAETNSDKITIQVDDDNMFNSFATQIGIVEIFKLLEIKTEAIYEDSIGELVSAYCNKKITFEDAMHKICQEKFKSFANLNVQSDFLVRKYSTYSCNSTILNISDFAWDSSLSLVDDQSIRFFEALGRYSDSEDTYFLILYKLDRLYEEGHNPQLHKLYPPVQFPVSRGTSIISPLIEWDYRKSWHTFRFGEFIRTDVIQQEYNMSTNLHKEQEYLLGHLIDGRNLIPATEYLELVRRTFVQSLKFTESCNTPIVFENCKFIKAVSLSKNGVVNLLVTIQKKSGNFEIVERNSLVVSGRILLADEIKQYENNLQICSIHQGRTEYLNHDEIYREMNLRGYNYTGLFKGILKCNVEVSAAIIKWENNWTTFLDQMLQIKFLEMNTTALYVPVCIKKLTINCFKHVKFTESCSDSLCPVFYNKEANIIKSGGIEISGIQAVSILKNKSAASPILEKHVFVPNSTKMTLEESVRIIIQIILENSLENIFKAVEILNNVAGKNPDLLSTLISRALDNESSVVANLTVSSEKLLDVPSEIHVEDYVLKSTSNLLLIIATNIFQNENFLRQIQCALSPNGFILSRERIDFVLENEHNIKLLTEHGIGEEKLVLLRKTKDPIHTKVIEVTSENFDWLTQLQIGLDKNVNVIIYSHNTKPEGILGFVNCLRREPKGDKVKCFFMMDQSPEFNVKNQFYESQIRKQMAVNVYKDGKWGTYRHLLLEDIQEVQRLHFFVKSTVIGDLSSLKWVEGSLTVDAKLNKGNILVFPIYSSVNFKDIMIASGRISVDSFTSDRIHQECCLGIEYCGQDIKGRRVMGIMSHGAMATTVVADSNLFWEIPDFWSFQEASTVPVVYATVLFGFRKVSQHMQGMSVLIHSATGGIGLAALNVCLYYGCDIYVTVGTQKKRDYLKRNFPQIPEEHIGNSRDTSFVEMINIGTKGRGVDVVLNSLSEEKLKATIRCVALGGHFLEIGKFDLYRDTSLDLLLLKKNINYHGVMLDRLFAKNSEMKIWVVDKLYEGIKLGYVKPLPRTVFQRDQVNLAYKFMTTGKHIGKIVVQIRDENCKIVEPKRQYFSGSPRFTCNPENVYIIIGGLGGFGLELADWLFLRGAKNLVFVSRFGIKSGYQNKKIMYWRSCGVLIHISTKDITTRQGCFDLVNETNKVAPIEGIFNLAVVLEDALFKDQIKELFSVSLAPKAQTTFYLDQITRESCPNLKYFVVFSSIICGRGNAGQTNYGMANSIMERICEKRKRDGLPGLAIQWGPIGDAGLVAKMQKENRELVIAGSIQQKISSCLEVLDKFLNQDNPVVASKVVAEKTNNIDLKTAASVVAYALGIKDTKTVHLNSSFAELGMDSMMGIEMTQILEKNFGIYLTAREMRNLTFAKLMEIEIRTKNDKDISNVKPEKRGHVLIEYFPRTLNIPMVRLSSEVKYKESGCTVFVLPGINGVFNDLELVTRNLKAHVFGVQYLNIDGSVLDHAQAILPYIEKTVSEEGTFHIISYSFGSIVAIELVGLLEARGFTGLLVCIDGSHVYSSTAARQELPSNDENEFQTAVLLRIVSPFIPTQHLRNAKIKYMRCKSFEERLELTKSQIPLELFEENLQEHAILALYNRYKSTVDYKCDLVKKIQSSVQLFKARSPLVFDIAEDYELSDLCEQAVNVTTVNGDHFTMLNQEQMVHDINKFLECN